MTINPDQVGLLQISYGMQYVSNRGGLSLPLRNLTLYYAFADAVAFSAVKKKLEASQQL